MVTVGHMMSEMTKHKVTRKDPVSRVLYKQFKKVLFLVHTPPVLIK